MVKSRVADPATLGTAESVIWVALSTLRTVVPCDNTPTSPPPWVTNIPATIPVVLDTVITAVASDNVVVRPLIVVGDTNGYETCVIFWTSPSFFFRVSDKENSEEL